MKCKLIEKKLIFYLENELNEKESVLVKAHLDECTKCNHLFDKMKQSLNLIGDDILKDSNPFFYTRIIAAIQSQNNSRYSWLKQKQFILQMTTYAFIIAFALIAGIFLGSGNTIHDQALSEIQSDTTDYQAFANSYADHFNKDIYMVELTTNEE